MTTPTRVSAEMGTGVWSLGHWGSDQGRQQEGLGFHWSSWPAQAGSILIGTEINVTNFKTDVSWRILGRGEQVKSWRLAYLEFLNHKSGGNEEHSGNSILQAGSS